VGEKNELPFWLNATPFAIKIIIKITASFGASVEIARCFPGFTILRLLFDFGRASEAGPQIFRSRETSVNLPQNKALEHPASEIKKRNGKQLWSKAYF
jgi:hypothetical protein